MTKSTTTGLTQSIQALARANKSPLPKKPRRPTKEKLQYMIAHQPDSLQAKLATSPYAAILASPLRYCTFHRRHYPSRLLQRFELGLDPETRDTWAYPSDHGDGHGYYVKLHQSVLALVQKQEHKRLFRGTAKYPEHMNQYLDQQMMQSLVSRVASVTYEPMDGSDHHHNGRYQCLLQLVQPSSSATTTEDDVIQYPFYTSSWQPLYEAVVAHVSASTTTGCVLPATLGIVKSMDSVSFAVDLFRYHQWLQSSPCSSSSKKKHSIYIESSSHPPFLPLLIQHT